MVTGTAKDVPKSNGGNTRSDRRSSRRRNRRIKREGNQGEGDYDGVFFYWMVFAIMFGAAPRFSERQQREHLRRSVSRHRYLVVDFRSFPLKRSVIL